MWLRDPDLLPSHLKSSRILTYGYDAVVASIFGKTSSDRILQHAHTLVAQVVADREVGLDGCDGGRGDFATEKDIVRTCDTTPHRIYLPLTWWDHRETSKAKEGSSLCAHH